jgi:hypothetical protein
MHVMTIEKQRRVTMMDGRNENGSNGGAERGVSEVKEPTWDHQSKSIKQLWMEFFNRLVDVDGAMLDGDERRIYDKIYQLHDELMMEQKRATAIDGSDEILVVHRPNNNLDWIHRNDDDIQLKSTEVASSVDVKWEKAESSEAPANDSFVKSVFNRFAQPRHPMLQQTTTVTQIASSIMSMMRESKDEKQLQERIVAMLIQDEMMRKLFSHGSSAPAFEVIPVPKSRAVSIKDSLEVTEKRLS